MTSEGNSVYELIKDLCKCIHKDNTDTEPTEQFVRHTKSIAYEILLKKSNKINELPDHPFDPFEELNFLEFEMHYTCKNNIQRERCIKFENCLDSTKGEDFFQADLGQSILRFLIALQGSLSQENQQLLSENNAPYCLMGTYFQNKYNSNPYHIIPLELMKFPVAYKKLFEDNADIRKNPYFPSFMQQGNTQKKKRFFTLPTDGSNENKIKFPNLLKGSSVNQMQPIEFTDTQMPKKRNVLLNSRTWECLGEAAENDPTVEKYASENEMSLFHMLAVHSKVNRTRFSAKVIEMDKIIEDIKYLLIGIRSEAFIDNPETLCFSMAPNLTIANVLPKTFIEFVQEFLECGTCYARLQSMCSKTVYNYDLKFDGFVFRVSFRQNKEAFLQSLTVCIYCIRHYVAA